MRIHRTVISTSVSLFLAVAGWAVAPAPVLAADQKPATIAAPVQSAAVASGAVEDPVQICLTRIPQGATAGQRLMAEQSCHRDESGRASMQTVPGR